MLNRIYWAFFAMAAVVASAEICFARLGETEAELEARYGKPYETIGDAAPAEKLLLFQKDGTSVSVRIFNGRSACEIYRFRDAKGNKIAIKDDQAKLKQILDANGNGAEWLGGASEAKEDKFDFMWMRSDFAASAAVYRAAPEALEVYTLEYFNKAKEAAK